MAIIGKTFDAQLVSAGDDGALYRMLAGRRDMLSAIAGGNPFTISNNVLSIAQSYLFLYGRFMRIAGGTTISLGTIPSNHVQGRVIVTLDMTKFASESTLSQIITEVETIASGGSFRSLTTNQDINSIVGQTSSKYEAVLCTFTCSSGTASSPVSALSTALSYPLAIANGGTGATARGNAFLGVSGMEYSNATDFDSIRLPGVYAINPSTTSGNHPTGGSDYGQLFVTCASQSYTGDYAMCVQIFTTLFADKTFIRSFANGSWRPWRSIRGGDIEQIAMTSQSLPTLTATRIKWGTSTTISGDGFGTWASDNSYITLPKGLYRFTTHFVATPGANGFIRSCLKIGSTSTSMIATDHCFAGAGCGSNSLLFGINASEVVNLTGSTNIYFLASSYNAIDSFQATVQIERIG